MSIELRKSGIDIIGDIPWGTHFCQFYRTPQDLADLLVPYFAAGLAGGEFCMWITSEPLDRAAAIRALAAAVPDIEDHLREGRIEVLPHDAWYLPDGRFESRRVLDAWAAKLEGARARGFAGLRLSGNTFWLEQAQWQAFTDYEAAVDEVIGRNRMLALCTYSLDRCGANEVLDVVRNHRFALVRRDAGWELVENTERERFRAAERRLTQFPEQNPHPVMRIDRHGSLLYTNSAARALLDALGHAAGASLPASVADLAAAAFVRDRDLEAEVPDGAGRTFELTAVHPPGELYANVYGHEVTNRVKAEKAVRDSEAKYRGLFESMAEGFALYELVDDEGGRPVDWRILEVNDAYTRHTGVPREKVVGKRASEVFSVSVEDYLPVFAKVVETGAAVDFETFARAVGRYQHVVTFPAGGRRFANIIEDITARRQAVEALRASEERYRALFNNMSEGFALHEIVLDEAGRPADYRFLDINPAFERLTGLRREDVVGRGVRQVLPDIEPVWIETYGRVALTGEPYKFERFYPAPLNRWFEIYAYRPAPLQFAVVFVDVTQRRAAEEALRESERRLERSQEIAHLGSWELDIPSDRLTWSAEVYRIFGLKPEESAATYEAFLEAVHPGDRSAVDDAYRSSLREGQDHYEMEHRIVRRDTGEVRIVHEKCDHLRDEAGRIVRSVGMVHDVTESRRAEGLRQALAEQERLRLGAAVELATEALAMAGPDGRVLYVNAAFEALHRVSKDEASGRSYFDLVAGDPRAAALREALARGGAWNGRLALTRPGERPVELEVVAATVADPPGLLITERDVTRETLLQDQVRQAQKMEALGTLAGGIAHDFNNILGAIFINTELAMLDTHDNCPAHDTLPLVLKAAQRGKELVKQITAFSRRQETPKTALRLEPVVREALGLFRATLPANVALEESISGGGAAVLAHPSQVHQVLSNLCQNAALAMGGRPGHVEVRLDTAEVDAETASRHAGLRPGAYARLTVADSGCGMPREVLDRVFEPFYTTRNPGEGSGLGLSVVHGVVKSCGGAITAYSEVGRGSTFNVFLPLAAGEGEETEAEAPPAGLATGRERILLVDDDPGQLESLSRMLGRLGYTVTAKPSGTAAEAAFRQDPQAFDLVITDQTMPGLTGRELARRLAAVRPDVRIVLNTGFSEKVNGETVGKDGIRAFLMKPFTAREISRVIREALRNDG